MGFPYKIFCLGIGKLAWGFPDEMHVTGEKNNNQSRENCPFGRGPGSITSIHAINLGNPEFCVTAHKFNGAMVPSGLYLEIFSQSSQIMGDQKWDLNGKPMTRNFLNVMNKFSTWFYIYIIYIDDFNRSSVL